ncbi:MAG TPA: ABC transporter permease, partial [Candidatus Limnocylindrales bacterium]|nr:ABC transporter permease [Candidatus Limnocylindrales bacterium]
FSREKPLPEATIAQLNAKYRLDEPLVMQYVYYITDIFVPRVTTGRIPGNSAEDYLVNIPLPAVFGEEAALRWMNFGPSYRSRGRSVNDIFRDNLIVSAQLGVAAITLALAVGMPLGIVAARSRNRWPDYVSMGIAVFGVSIPVIISAPVLQYLFGVQWKLFPVTGWGTPAHIVLPAVALGFINSAIIARLTRASLLQVMHEDYIRTARAKGLGERSVLIRHALRNSLIPVITVLGPLFAALVTGTFVIETVFGIPGMGRYFVSSVQSRDYPVIMGTILLYAFLLVLANMFVDIVYAWIDPRIRLD